MTTKSLWSCSLTSGCPQYIYLEHRVEFTKARISVNKAGMSPDTEVTVKAILRGGKITILLCVLTLEEPVTDIDYSIDGDQICLFDFVSNDDDEWGGGVQITGRNVKEDGNMSVNVASLREQLRMLTEENKKLKEENKKWVENYKKVMRLFEEMDEGAKNMVKSVKKLMEEMIE